MSGTHTWSDLLTTLVQGRDLTREQAAWAMTEIMSGGVSPARVAGFLVALRAKGETVEEFRALADVMLANARRIQVPGRTVDIVGSGGDRTHTVNISTMAAIVIAGTGLRVVKHGGRAASSASGSADVLEALGIRLDQPAERVAELATEVGITFCFSQVFHPSMRHAAGVRGELGIATAFNFLGPVSNPAQPAASAIGVADARMAELISGVLAARGSSALVFRGDDGLDELAPTGAARVWEVRDGDVTEHRVHPADELGLRPVTIDELRGEDAEFNAGVVRQVLAGDAVASRETVLLNAATGIVADGTLPGTGEGTLAERLHAGMEHARRAVDEGAAAAVLERWRAAAA